MNIETLHQLFLKSVKGEIGTAKFQEEIKGIPDSDFRGLIFYMIGYYSSEYYHGKTEFGVAKSKISGPQKPGVFDENKYKDKYKDIGKKARKLRKICYTCRNFYLPEHACALDGKWKPVAGTCPDWELESYIVEEIGGE